MLWAILLIFSVFVESNKLGPLDLTTIFEESPIMYGSDYNAYHSFVNKTFAVGKSDTETHLINICDGAAWDTEDDFWHKCKKGSKFTKNFDQSFKKAFEITPRAKRGITKPPKPPRRDNVPQVLILLTDGKLSELKPDQVTNTETYAKKLISKGTKIFIFHIFESKLTKDDMSIMEKITNSRQIIYFDINDQSHAIAEEKFKRVLCEYDKLPDCKEEPEEGKCTRNVTEYGIDGCFDSKTKDQCHESECYCERLYPWPEKSTGQCSTTCGEGYEIFERDLPHNSDCPQKKESLIQCKNNPPCPGSDGNKISISNLIWISCFTLTVFLRFVVVIH